MPNIGGNITKKLLIIFALRKFKCSYLGSFCFKTLWEIVNNASPHYQLQMFHLNFLITDESILITLHYMVQRQHLILLVMDKQKRLMSSVLDNYPSLLNNIKVPIPDPVPPPKECVN